MIIVLRPGTGAEARREIEAKIRELGCEIKARPCAPDDVVLVAEGTREAEITQSIAGFDAVERTLPLPPVGAAVTPRSRRSFLSAFAGVIGGVLALTAAGVSGMFFWSRGGRRTRRDIVSAGRVEDFDRRPWRLVESEGAPVLVVRTAAKDYRALSSICTHSEICQVEWDARREQVVCPCHRSAYDVFGNVLHGPPPRPLRTYPVAVIDGGVYVKFDV
jgi:cytochrome b6-f complex iron-sulfur subunit